MAEYLGSELLSRLSEDVIMGPLRQQLSSWRCSPCRSSTVEHALAAVGQEGAVSSATDSSE